MLRTISSDGIVRYRGDTLGDKFTITSDGTTPVDITLYTARMTVNTLKDPTDDNPGVVLFTLTGAIDDAPNGVFLFEPSSVQADQEAGTYFYDVELTTPAGNIITVAKGSYKFKQDISK